MTQFKGPPRLSLLSLNKHTGTAGGCCGFLSKWSRPHAALHQTGEVTSDLVAYIEQWSRGRDYWRKLLWQMLLRDVSCSAIVVCWENTLAWGEEENRDHRLNSSDILPASSSLCSQMWMLYNCFSLSCLLSYASLWSAYLFFHVCLPLCHLVFNMWLPCSHLFAFCSLGLAMSACCQETSLTHSD